MGDWQTMDTAPKDGRLILLATAAASPLHGMFCAYWNSEWGEWMFHIEGVVRSPAFWQPLPLPPGDGK